MADTALVVTQPAFLASPVAGGVQVCTAEFVALFRAAGYDLRFHHVRQRRDPLTRIRLRFRLEAYGGYDFAGHAQAVAREAAGLPGALVVLNQMDISPLAPAIHRLDQTLPVVVLSHGNASGDFLHEGLPATGLARLRNRWRLGAQLARESELLQRHIDLVVVISETDEAIDRWLGARHVLTMPRVFTPAPLDWSPVPWRIGIVSTADHFPNRAGIERLCEALRGRIPPECRIRLVGGGAAAARELQARFPFIEYLGQLPDEALHAEAATWSLFAHPLFWHARGASTKLATAINWGLPIVTTPAGRRGYRWTTGTLPEAVEPGELAALVVDVLGDRQRLHAARAETLKVAASGPSLLDYAGPLRAAIGAARQRRTRS